MKKTSKMKRILSLFLVLVTLVSTVSIMAVSASAASYDTNYSRYNEPESNDFARWNGNRVVKGSNTNKNEIRWMQASLNYCIQNRGLRASYLTVDGSFGPASKQATIAFQRAYGLTADGSFGPSTIKKMKSVISASAAPSVDVTSKTLTIDWDLMKKAGKQGGGEKNCLCYSLAYSRVILDKESHKWTEYSEGYLRSVKRYSYTAVCSKAGYKKLQTSSAQTLYKAIYDNINAGKPVIINVEDGRSTGCHYIAIVGYTNVTDTSKMSLANFLMFDSVGKQYYTENVAAVGYTLRKSGGVYSYYID